nr:ribonuclease H-like domain-containing protein [Tanacetum cinerariifolium]
MRTKPGVDTLNFDDLYNNLRVFESYVTGSTGSSSSTQNVAFVSSDNTSSTNEVNNTFSVSTSCHNLQKEGSTSYTDDLMYSFFANQSTAPQLDHEDLEQVDEFDLEMMDLKWQVAMISIRLKKFYKKIGRKLHFDAKEPVGFDKSKVECFNCHNTRYFARECRSKGNQDNRRRDAGNTRYKARTMEKDLQNKMNIKFCNSGSDTKVTSCSKVCEESYAKLKKLYYDQREQLGDVSIEIQAYTLALKSSPPMTGNYMPPKSNFGIDESKFTYGPKQSTTSESDAKTSALDSCESSSSEEILETMPKPVDSNPKDNPHQTLKGKGIVDSGRSRHMTENKAYLVDYQDFNGGLVAFEGSKGQITGKGKIRTRKSDFEDVYFVKELQHFNLFFVSQMCDKNKVLFTDTECLVLSFDFKLPDKNQVLLRVPRQHNMYKFNLENIVSSGGLAYLIAKATIYESTKWHM